MNRIAPVKAIYDAQANAYKACDGICSKDSLLCRERIFTCKRLADVAASLNQTAALTTYNAGKIAIAASLEVGKKECRILFPCASN